MAKNLIRRHTGYKGMAKIGRETRRPDTFEKQKTENTMFTITPSKHTQTGKDIWVAKLETRVSTDEFNELRKKIGKLGGYYSRFVSGFVFNEDPTDKLRSLSAGLPVTSEPKMSKRLDLPKLQAERKSPRKDVIIKEIQEGKMEYAIHKSFNPMSDSEEYRTVTTESFSPAENLIREYKNGKKENPLIEKLERAKGQSHYIYSASVHKSNELGYYIYFGDYYIRYKGETGTGEKPKEEISGGKAEGMSMEDIANKHGRDLSFMMEQLEKGSEVEMEHTNDHDKAIEIAKDHLFESPDYYIELEKMEKKLEKQSESEKPVIDELGSSENVVKYKLPDIKGRSNDYGYSFQVDSIQFDKRENEGLVDITGQYDRYGNNRKTNTILYYSISNDKLFFHDIIKRYKSGEKYVFIANSSAEFTSKLMQEHFSKGFADKIWDFIIINIYPLRSEKTGYESMTVEELFDGKKADKPLTLKDIPESVKIFMPKFQQDIIIGSVEHKVIIDNLAEIIDKMPSVKQRYKGKLEDKIIYLHYFYGKSDWYISEKDSESEQLQAFGYVILNGDMINSEWGYINVEEIKEINKIELDFFFDPIKFSELNINKVDEPSDSGDDEQRQVFGYSFNFYDKNNEAEVLLKALTNLGITDIVTRPEEINAVSFLYNGNKYELYDNDGEFKIYYYQSHHPIVIYFKEEGEPLKSIEQLATEIESEIIKIEKSKKGTTEDIYLQIKDFYIHKTEFKVLDREGNTVYYAYNLDDCIKWVEDQYKPILGEKPYRVFTVTKDGSEGLYRDNLTFNEAEQLYNDELKNPNAEIITWDKTIYNEHGKVSSHENIKMEIHKDPEPEITDQSKEFEKEVKEGIRSATIPLKSEKKEPETKAEKVEDSTNKKIRDLIAQKDLNRHLYSRADLLLLTQYTGDIKTQEETKDGYLWDYYTPDETVKLCWQLAFKYGFRASESRKILEPSAGAGRFLRYAPDYCQVTAYEIDEIAYKICTLLYPKFNIIHDSFESNFYIRSGLKGFNYKPVYDTFNLIIGNPPYMYPYTSVYKEKEKAVYPFIQSLEQWFLIRACDALEKNGLLIFIIPSSIVDNNSSYREFKDAMAKKVNMLDLYRLPSGTFKNTDITTDVIVLQKK
ncbi:MAG: N-6 DNA methylase [Atribacterota bacterium]|nr:N-6 DNA methylase [Atribacterota bacterium]